MRSTTRTLQQMMHGILANAQKKCHATTLPVPSLTTNEVLVHVHAAGVNRPDIMQRAGLYPPPPGASPVLGLELAGIVCDLGSSPNAQGLQVGDNVCALVTGGGYAEYCAVDADMCLPIPNQTTFATMSCFPETTYTVWQNLFSDLPDANSVRLRPDEILLVHGATSGIGSTALQLAKARGCTVIATAGSDDKVRACVDIFGADAAFNYNTVDWVDEVKAFTQKDARGDGVDVVLDMVGGEYLQRNLNVLGTRGRLRIIGFMQSPITQEINMMRVLLKQIQVSGSVLRSRPIALKRELTREIATHVMPLVEQGVVLPHLHQVFDASASGEGEKKVRMEQAAAEAHGLMETNQHVGKIAMQYR